MIDALVIGGGPAGLMAADVLSAAGRSVVLCDAMPTVGRKFLMAGKSGLNLTKAEPLAQFKGHFGGARAVLDPALSAFGPDEVSSWAESLGQTVFTGSTGRVFPTVMKASPLLRAWLLRLEAQGVDIRTRWRFTGWNAGDAVFDTPDRSAAVPARTTVLAMGGASWKRLGSDGQWAGLLLDAVTPFKPMNVGFHVPWSPHMAAHFGSAVKGCALHAGGGVPSRGEFVISAKGIEGGGVYAVSAALRDGAALSIDLAPDLDVATVAKRVAAVKGKATTSNRLRKGLGFDAIKIALFNEFGRGAIGPMADIVKALPIGPLIPRPMDEAISTGGGVRFDALTPDLMLRSRAGVFCAGEMLDWEAPTGGYLITGCLATGRWAGLAARRYLQTS